jgi:hypothetical protein
VAGGDLKAIRSAAIELDWLTAPPSEARPGESIRIPFRITNRGPVRSISNVRVEGEAAAWCRIDRGDPGRQLFRDQFDNAELLIVVPRDATPAHIDLRLLAQADNDANWVELSLKVLESLVKPPDPPVAAFTPPTVRLQKGTSTPVTLTVQNPEDDPVEYTLAVTGLSLSWEGAFRPTLAMAPRARESMTLLLPPAEDIAPGQYVVTAIVSRADGPEINTPAHCAVEVPQEGETKGETIQKPVRPPAVTVTPNPLNMVAGQSEAQLAITVTNLSDLHEVYRLSAVGPPDWCRLETAEIALAPGESRTVNMVVAPFVSRDYASGQHRVRIGVAPLNLPKAAQIRVISVVVPKQYRFDLDAEPAGISGRKERIKVRLANTGTAELDLKLFPQFTGRSCDVRLPQVIHLDLEERRVVTGAVGAHRSGLLGRRSEYAFQVAGVAQGLDPPLQKVSREIRFTHEPFMTHRFAGLTLFAAFLLTALIILLQIGPSHAFNSTRDAIECRLNDTKEDPRGGPDIVKPKCIPEAEAS